MASNLLKEILEYDRDKNKFLTRSQLEEILFYLAEKYGIEEYVKTICFVKGSHYKNKDIVAAYEHPTKTVYIFESCIKVYRRVMSSEYTLEDKSLKKVFLNEAIIQVLMHELSHTSHLKYLYEQTDYDLKFEILRYSYFYEFVSNCLKLPYLKRYYGSSLKTHFGLNYDQLIRELKAYYEVYHRYNDEKSSKKYDKNKLPLQFIDPTEINAEYESFRQIIYLNEILNPELNKDWKELLFLKTQGLYIPTKSRVISPFEIFVKKRDSIITLDRFDITRLKEEELPLDMRLSFGLPISKKEFNGIEDHIMSLHL